MGFYSKFLPNSNYLSELLLHPYPSLGMLFIDKVFNSIACLLYFINLQLVIPGRTWILLYLGRTVYKRLWACLALYVDISLSIESALNEHALFPRIVSTVQMDLKPVKSMCAVKLSGPIDIFTA